MPREQPPRRYAGPPNRHVLRRGACLWRLHNRAYDAFAFNPSLAAEVWGGARFDATAADPYPYYYAGLTEETALAETLLRDLGFGASGYRLVQREKVHRRRLSALVVLRDLNLVSLVNAEDLAAVAQDAWLVTAPAHEYPQTRTWAHWLRRQAPWAHGLIWDSLRDRGGLAMVLFGDRLNRDFGADYEKAVLHEITGLAVDLDEAAGTAWVNERLRRYRAAMSSDPG